MSGCGRKHRAKHLVRQFLDDDAWDGPDASKGDVMAVCIASPSAKHVHVVLVDVPTTTTTATKTDEKKEQANEEGGEVSTAEKKGKTDEVAATTACEGEASSSVLTAANRSVANLPGKFNKVLWLGCGDLIILRLGTVHYKPSPPQLKYFYSSPEGEKWGPNVQKAESAARLFFSQVQSQTVTHATNQNLSGGGKFTVRNADVNANSRCGATTESVQQNNIAAAAAAAQSSTTTAKHAARVAVSDPLAGMMNSDDDEDGDDLNKFVNPNRQSIKHRREAFFPDENEDHEEEDEEGEEEECEEEEDEDN